MKNPFSWLARLFGRRPRPEPEAPAAAPAPEAPPAAAARKAARKAAAAVRKAPAPRPRAARQPRQYSPQRLTEVLRGPHVSEKSVRLAEGGQHTFEVARDASRAEIRAAVERMFEVEVAEVRVANVRGKRKRDGARAAWRKAYVRLAPGQALDTGEAAA